MGQVTCSQQDLMKVVSICESYVNVNAAHNVMVIISWGVEWLICQKALEGNKKATCTLCSCEFITRQYGSWDIVRMKNVFFTLQAFPEGRSSPYGSTELWGNCFKEAGLCRLELCNHDLQHIYMVQLWKHSVIIWSGPAVLYNQVRHPGHKEVNLSLVFNVVLLV